jgi:hypothetical protein
MDLPHFVLWCLLTWYFKPTNPIRTPIQPNQDMIWHLGYLYQPDDVAQPHPAFLMLHTPCFNASSSLPQSYLFWLRCIAQIYLFAAAGWQAMAFNTAVLAPSSASNLKYVWCQPQQPRLVYMTSYIDGQHSQPGCVPRGCGLPCNAQKFITPE